MNSSHHTRLTDQEILKNFYNGHDNQWLGPLLERYTILLFGVCMKYLKDQESARDAVQQIFLKAITELHKYEVSFFGSWIYMIAKNHCLMMLRNQHREIPVASMREPMTESSVADPMEDERLLRELGEAMQHLNPEQKTCIRMFYLEKKSYRAISTLTGFSLLQVKSYIQNGKRNLRLLLEKKMDKLDSQL